MMRRYIVLSLLLMPLLTVAQNSTVSNLKEAIVYLSSDELAGRMTGTVGERLAAKYIQEQFEKLDLEPLGDEGGFTQAFTFTSGRKYTGTNSLSIGKTKVPLGHDTSSGNNDYYPVVWSGNGSVTGNPVFVGFGIEAPDLKHNDYENVPDLNDKVFVMEFSSPDGIHPHSKYAAHSDPMTKLELAISKGAVAVIFVNSDPDLKDPKVHRDKAGSVDIPVVFLRSMENYFPEGNKKWGKVSLSVGMEKVQTTAHNVLGFQNNSAATTVVVGAHYDHLGHGEHGSLYRGEPAIHNGADDNASGVAGIIELARHTTSSERKSNYLFIAFSGEELGLFGSNYFTKNPTLSLEDISYMINLDMIGRLDSMVMINGVGTSPGFGSLITNVSAKTVPVKTSKSGIGPSDHTSFYLQDIPVLHFFTGAHEDYHKPSDDADKVNYEGEVRVLEMISMIMDSLDASGKVAFTKTKEEDNKNVPRFTVTLGVVPDYMFDGKGMRIDGVTDGKPASKAGILKGDIVILMGDIKVSDMMSYMKGLSKFKKGDTTKVTVVREGKEVTVDVTF